MIESRRCREEAIKRASIILQQMMRENGARAAAEAQVVSAPLKIILLALKPIPVAE